MSRKPPYIRYLLIYLATLLVSAAAVNGLMYLSIPTYPSLSSSSWLGFWGSYLGGAIGCVPALLALLHSMAESKSHREEIQTERRLSVLPVFSCKDNSISFTVGPPEILSTLSVLAFLDPQTGFHDSFSSHDPRKYQEKVNGSDESYLYVFFEWHNIGAGPALNVSLSCSRFPSHTVPLHSMGAGEAKTVVLGIQPPLDSGKDALLLYEILVSFSDVFGNTYTQRQPLIVKKDAYTISEISVPARNDP